MLTRKMLLLALLVVILCGFVDARGRNPLIEDDGPKIKNRASECIFGNQVRELGSTWVPNLGVPIGVLYCIKCECVQIQRKRRLVAKVTCRNIKNECPVPTCAEPVLGPERCCKSCPGDNSAPDIPIQDVIRQDMVDGEEKNVKHYAVLLTDRSSLQLWDDNNEPILNDNKNNVIATGRFTFHKRNLYYSFYISDKAARPRTLQFVDEERHILEEHILSDVGGQVNSRYQNATRKVCGVWKRLSKDYRRLLREEKLYVVLGWGTKEQNEFTLSGQLTKYVALGTELFSSLLEPSHGSDLNALAGSGGTGIVSISTHLAPSIHVAVVFNGIFSPNEISNVPVNLTLALDDRRVILTEKVNVTKPASELNVVEISSPISQSDLRLLTRGRLVLSIASVSNPTGLRLSGMVMTKATCELFQTPLSSAGDVDGNKYGTSGLAWLFLNNEGSLVYNVQVDDLSPEQKPVYITLVDITGKKKTELEDLTPSFSNGWANGTIEKLSPKVLEPLYSGNLAVNVVLNSETNTIRGRLTPKLVADARDAVAPVLLKREDFSLPTSAVGMGWFAVDNDCSMHYDVSLTGLPPTDKLEISLKFLPKSVPDAPYTIRVLGEFQGNQAEGGHDPSLTSEELARLETGVVFVKITDKNTKNILLNSTLKRVKVPQLCASQNVTSGGPPSDPPDSRERVGCFYDGRYYKEDSRWTSIDNPCTMCFCQNGQEKCFTSKCPDRPCRSGILTRQAGECCPVCRNPSLEDDTMRKDCVLNGQSYRPGSVFYPFLIPTGFDFCTECECDGTLAQVRCSRKSSCDATTDGMIRDDTTKGAKLISVPEPWEILKNGGCNNSYNTNKPYMNGQKYHPVIESLGEYKCVTCECNNGEHRCWREKCTKKMCKEMRQRKNSNLVTRETCCSTRQCKKPRNKRRNNSRSPL